MVLPRVIAVQVTPKLSDDEVRKLIEKLKQSVGIPNCNNVILVLTLIMEKLKDMSKLNGTEKRNLAIYCLYKLGEGLEDDDYESLSVIISKVVPTAIDTIIDVAKNKISFSSKKDHNDKLWFCFV